MAWQQPKTNWVINPKSPVGEDFNRIEGNIDFLKADIETKKGAIVNALNTVGLETELTDTHAQIANKIVAANQGTKIYTPGTANITIPKGFHSGQGYVKGDVNLVPANIAKGKSIFGVNGSYITPVINSIQQGQKSTNSTTTSIDIDTVNLDSSIFIVEIIKAISYVSGNGYIKADTLTSTQFEVTAPRWSGTTQFIWKVIEFNPDIVKSLQRGNVTIPYESPYTIDVSVNSVNTQKSVLLVQGDRAVNISDKAYPQIRNAAGILTSSNNIKFVGAGQQVIAFWQLIEFY